jgi:uncharacterized protein
LIAAAACRLVEFARRHAAAMTLFSVLSAALSGYYAATHLTIDTDVERMLPADLLWRREERAFDRAFPHNRDLLVIVIDGRTPELADAAAAALAKKLAAEPRFFKNVRRPDGGDFFERNGILFQSREAVEKTAQELVKAQPLLGGLAHDPSLRGLFDATALFAQAAQRGDVSAGEIDPALASLDGVTREVLAGKTAFLSWQRMVTGKPAGSRELRRFILTQPVLDYAAIEPGARATAEVRRLAQRLPLEGVSVRMTGPVALNDAQFADLHKGAFTSSLLSLGLVCVILLLALRSPKLVVAILLTLACGLLLTAGFAALAVGSLNPISIAFTVLFVGLAADFGIQFAVRYRSERHRLGELGPALAATGHWACGALMLAAGATAIGFFSFLPTNYAGVAQLGLIAGAGMIIGFTLNFLLLPALITLVHPSAEPQTLSFRWARPVDRFLLQHRRWVLCGALLLAALGLAALPRLSFDFDPLDLKNPNSEAVRTLFDLVRDPTANPYTAEVLAPSLSAAESLAARLSRLPEVAEARTVSSFIPGRQKKKLAAIGDLSLLLGPTLTPISRRRPPTAAEVLGAVAQTRDALVPLAAKEGAESPAARFSRTLKKVLARGPAIVPALDKAIISGLPQELALLRKLLTAKRITLKTLPQDLRRDWLAADGRARIALYPRGNVRDREVLRRFVGAVRKVAPTATGPAVTILEIGRMVTGAFIEAGAIGIAAIAGLLWIVLRRLRDVLFAILPLVLAGILTLATAVVLGTPLNYANIIALPLFLGIGVAFDIYFVANWRAGTSEHLQSSTARAVIFSALTTMSAFGSLALSSDPGLSAIGKMLFVSLGYTLFSTLVILPSLLGPAPLRAGRALPAGERWKGGLPQDLRSR